MPTCRWEFEIRYSPKNEQQTSSIGIFCESAADVVFFSNLAGLDIKKAGEEVFFRVNQLEGSPELKSLLEGIEKKYGYKPAENFVVSVSERKKFFGLYKKREYTPEELDSADLLYLNYSRKGIAKDKRLKDDGLSSERYICEKRKKKKTVPFGVLEPSHALAVAGELKSQMEDVGLVGLDVSEPVINGDDIWKLSSIIKLPRCNLRLIDGTGQEVDPDDWSGKFCQKYFDDRGYRPPELTYSRSEIGKLGEFDIAVTAERTGNSVALAARWCVVSQRFRQTMETLKVPGVVYVPVRLT